MQRLEAPRLGTIDEGETKARFCEDSSIHKSLSDLYREFGVSRPTGYRWISHY